MEKNIFVVASIILNTISCPFVILMNTLVIFTIKTRPTLQSNHNILLACLAGTDLLVGTAAQPSFIAVQIVILKGLPLNDYCDIFRSLVFVLFIPLLASLYHLTILNVERYVAMKYPLDYVNIVTKRRLKVALASVWVISVCPAISRSVDEKGEDIVRVLGILFSIVNILVTCYCHVSIFLVVRRFGKRIQSEEVSPEMSANFIKDKTAAKTTRIIIMAMLCCYFPSFVYVAVIHIFDDNNDYFVNVFILSHPFILSFYLINSLFNPIICFYRNRMLYREAKGLLRKIIE